MIKISWIKKRNYLRLNQQLVEKVSINKVQDFKIIFLRNWYNLSKLNSTDMELQWKEGKI